jgi:hypothetical protein
MRPDPGQSAALLRLTTEESLRVRQQKEWGEILTGWETKNRYQIVGRDDRPLLMAGEVGDGLGAFLMRAFLKKKRPFTIELRTPAGELFLRLVRPWRWFFSTMEVFNAQGTCLGTLQQRFRFFGRQLDILGPSGEELAVLNGPLFRPWTFKAEKGGIQVGMIQKKWSGFGKELFTDADNFGVSFATEMNDERLRTLMLAATFLIDFVYFENAGG